jgi:hypothetical protein
MSTPDPFLAALGQLCTEHGVWLRPVGDRLSVEESTTGTRYLLDDDGLIEAHELADTTKRPEEQP